MGRRVPSVPLRPPTTFHMRITESKRPRPVQRARPTTTERQVSEVDGNILQPVWTPADAVQAATDARELGELNTLAAVVLAEHPLPAQPPELYHLYCNALDIIRTWPADDRAGELLAAWRNGVTA